MFSTNIDMKTIKEVREFLDSDDSEFVEDMNRAGLSFPAMALVIQAIYDKCAEVEKVLKGE